MAQKIALVILIATILAGCATSQKPIEAEEALFQHAKSWEQFRIDGVIEMNYRQLSFRKDIVIRKSAQRFRIDIFDTGLFGVQPTPFLTIYREDEILIRDNDGVREADPVSDSLYIAWVGQLSMLSDVIQSNYHKILYNWEFEKNNLRYKFQWNYLLESIASLDGGNRLEFSYTNSDQLSGIRYRENGVTVIDIVIDKIDFKPLQVKALTNKNQGTR